MRALSGISNLGANYALHVDVALEPDKSSEDVVVVVRDGVIADVSSAAAFLPARDLPPPIRLPGTAIIPGIMDVHHHIIEPFAKALTGGEPAQLWRRFWLPLEAVATPRTVYIGAKWTFLEALRGGITTIVDHGLRSRDIVDAIHRAADETGIRLVSSTGAYDKKNFSTSAATPGADNSIHDALAIARQHLDDCKGFKRISPSIACGTVQSNSGDMIAALSGFCRDQNILFQIHANEHTLEVHASIEASGRRPIEYLHDLGALGSHVLIAHATLVTSEEIKMLATTDTAVAYNPVASLWKGNAVSPVLDFFSAGIRVGLGSDATRNDGFRMIDAAEACQRIAYGMPRDDFSCGAGWRWIDVATRGGAGAAMLGKAVGQIAPGFKADFLLLDRTGPEVLPSWDFAWELVRFYDRADILATFVDGEAVSIGGRSTRLDSGKFFRDVHDEGVQWTHDAKMIRLHGASDLYRPGASRAPI